MKLREIGHSDIKTLRPLEGSKKPRLRIRCREIHLPKSVRTPRWLSGNPPKTPSGWRTISLKQHLHENRTNNLPCLGGHSIDGLRRLEPACHRDTHSYSSCSGICARRNSGCARCNSCDDSGRATRVLAAANFMRRPALLSNQKKKELQAPPLSNRKRLQRTLKTLLAQRASGRH